MNRLTDILQPWQKRYFQAFQTHSKLISICSRQIGKSFISAWCAVYDCIVNNATWTLVSTGQRSADELLTKCLLIARYFEGMLQGTPLHFTFTNNATRIRFSNGATIISLPNNPDGLRGFSSSLLLDEFAFISNAEEVWKACIPFLTSPHGAEKKLQIISTPAGQSGKFYELWTHSDYFKTKVTLEDAVNEGGLNIDIGEIKKTVMDDAVYAQEYLCQFIDSDSALFPYSVLRNSVYTDKPTGGKVYIGIDIGRSHDKTSIAVLREINGNLYINHVESLTNKEFSFQESYIANLIKSLNPVKVCIDATGIGANLAENLHRKFATVKEVKFTNETKNEMFTLTRTKLGRTLFIPNDNALIEDLHKIRRLVSPSGNLSFGASRDDTGHADDATAVALAVYATRKPPTIFLPIDL